MINTNIKNDVCSPIFRIHGFDDEILRFESDGNIYLHGELIENDKELVDGFREFLRQQNLYAKS
jgi:hypothetical protein